MVGMGTTWTISEARRRSVRDRMPAPRRDSLLDDLRVAGSEAFTIIEVLIVVTLLGLISAIALPAYMDALDKARVGRAIGDIAAISEDISLFWFDNGRYPANLGEVNWAGRMDPYGEPYAYLNIGDSGKGGKGGGGGGGRGGGGGGGGGGGASAGGRKDRFLVPVNSDFDLYSMGKDKESVIAFTAKKSHDDIVRANNGAFIGLAEDF